ncbi:MAG: hypothetical protein PHQ87_13110 [Hydrogenophaga sp.]|uniref:hypothetical protein n=1 Tax=Hydrogenophaga sp. TaxID=1904254 RepID=UPI0026082232|nr:hypothetical protein [Hydrogenophaga sp.]MDD3786478.1 hypothetical protein [Hydrogenophaga sp.]
MSHRAQPGAAVSGQTARAGRRRHLLFLEPHIQWSVLSRCLRPDDLLAALGSRCSVPPSRGDGADPLVLLEEAARWLGEDPLVCQRLQFRLDELASASIRSTAACRDIAELEAVWSSSRGDAGTAPVYWALVSHGLADAAFRRQLYRGFGAPLATPLASGAQDARMAGVLRLSGDMLEALRREKDHSAALTAALQIESALRRQSQRRVEELEQRCLALDAGPATEESPSGVADTEVMAHPVAEWRVARLDGQGRAAIQLTDARGIGGAFVFDAEELQAIHTVIGDLVRPSEGPAHSPASSASVN